MTDNTWKISDFGLTKEGTSRYAYTTKGAHGTESYRTPELVREYSVVTQTSDIWALGCILYELAYKSKAFPRDFHVFEYIRGERIPQIDPLPANARVQSYLRELIGAMLELNWWERPSARAVLVALESILEDKPHTVVSLALEVVKAETSEVKTSDSNDVEAQSSTDFAINDLSLSAKSKRLKQENSQSAGKISLEEEDKAWMNARWACCWYTLCICC